MAKAVASNFVSAFEQLLQCAGLLNRRNVYWSRYEPKNFGDWITPYLYEKMNNKKPLFFSPRKSGRHCGWPATTVLGAGSIFRHIKRADMAIVWGSGIISVEDDFERPKEIVAVRGPLTRQSCLNKGFECPPIYGDPAILFPKFYTPKDNTRRFALGIIPHYINLDFANQFLSNDGAFKIIDVTQPPEAVIDDIAKCERTVSGSLHGLILSHAYGIRSTWVEFGRPLMGDGTKFHDYFMAFGDYSNPDPVFVTEGTSAEELLEIANYYDVPDQKKLWDPLLNVCPFFKPKVVPDYVR